MHINRKGQATTEMAIFGSLILVCFSILLTYGSTMSEQQTLQQQAFRAALQKAWSDNGFVSYGIIKTTRNPNLFGGYREGSRGSASANGAVLWAKGKIDSYSYYQVNDDGYFQLHNFKQGSGTEAKLPSVYDVSTSAATNYSNTDTKNETTSNITTNRSANLTDTVTITMKTKYDSAEGPAFTVTQSLDNDGHYKSGGSGISRSRQWRTAH